MLFILTSALLSLFPTPSWDQTHLISSSAEQAIDEMGLNTASPQPLLPQSHLPLLHLPFGLNNWLSSYPTAPLKERPVWRYSRLQSSSMTGLLIFCTAELPWGVREQRPNPHAWTCRFPKHKTEIKSLKTHLLLNPISLSQNTCNNMKKWRKPQYIQILSSAWEDLAKS